MQQIEIGQMVFLRDGEVGVGAVRDIRNDGDELVINIENGGDFVLPASVVRDVHSGKVMLDVDKLPDDVRNALRHPHDNELQTSTYAGSRCAGGGVHYGAWIHHRVVYGIIQAERAKRGVAEITYLSNHSRSPSCLRFAPP